LFSSTGIGFAKTTGGQVRWFAEFLDCQKIGHELFRDDGDWLWFFNIERRSREHFFLLLVYLKGMYTSIVVMVNG
jgi:hypothetical protein